MILIRKIAEGLSTEDNEPDHNKAHNLDGFHGDDEEKDHLPLLIFSFIGHLNTTVLLIVKFIFYYIKSLIGSFIAFIY